MINACIALRSSYDLWCNLFSQLPSLYVMLAEYRQAIAQHRQRVYSFAHYSLRAADDAEDVTQEVFIKLWQHWQKIDHERISAWLMRVAHNAVVDHIRRQKHVHDNLDQYQEVEGLDDSVEHGELLDRESFSSRVEEVVRALDDPFRSILIMRDIQGMSYAEIEGSLDLSASQVKVYLHRGRRKLRSDKKLRAMFDALYSSKDYSEAQKETTSMPKQEGGNHVK